jgi:hypothetical protein
MQFRLHNCVPKFKIMASSFVVSRHELGKSSDLKSESVQIQLKQAAKGLEGAQGSLRPDERLESTLDKVKRKWCNSLCKERCRGGYNVTYRNWGED